MKNQPLISRIAETAALIVIAWPLAVTASICYLFVSITLEIATRVLGVWE